MGLFSSKDPKPKITFVESDDIPDCPHCGQPLTTVKRRSKGFIEQTIVFSCGHCNKLLSIGYNLGT